MQSITFWSFCLYTTMAFPKMQMFILTWSWCQKPLWEIKGLPSLAFSPIKPYISFKCLVNNHLAHYEAMQMPTLHYHFNPSLIHFLSFWTILSGRGCWWLSGVNFNFWIWNTNSQKTSFYILIKETITLNLKNKITQQNASIANKVDFFSSIVMKTFSEKNPAPSIKWWNMQV